MSEYILKVGERGEIYTTKELRLITGIKRGGRVRAIVKDRKLIIEVLPTIEELLQQNIVELTPQEAEEISEEAQVEEGIYG